MLGASMVIGSGPIQWPKSRSKVTPFSSPPLHGYSNSSKEHAIKAEVIHLLRPFSDEDQIGIGRVTSPSGTLVPNSSIASGSRSTLYHFDSITLYCCEQEGKKARVYIKGKSHPEGNTSVSAFSLEWNGENLCW
ncbi:hypothetical protein GQ457_01G021440 [Hibiscus cannabinus]